MADSRRSAGIWRFVREGAKAWDHERLLLVLLDRRHKVIGVGEVPPARLSAASVRRVFRGIPLNEAASLLAIHNHPKSDQHSSTAAEQAAKRLDEIAGELGVPRSDHVLFQRGVYLPPTGRRRS